MKSDKDVAQNDTVNPETKSDLILTLGELRSDGGAIELVA